MTVAERTEELVDLRRELDEELERHQDEVNRIRGEIAEAESKRAHEAAGTTEEELDLARGLVEVTINGEPEYQSLNIDEQVIQEAVEDLAGGCLTLRSEFFCRRHYAGTFVRETYRYGMGPKHGNVVFSIGLTKDTRDFFKRWNKIPTGEGGEAVNAAIRYLLGLKEAGQP